MGKTSEQRKKIMGEHRWTAERHPTHGGFQTVCTCGWRSAIVPTAVGCRPCPRIRIKLSHHNAERAVEVVNPLAAARDAYALHLDGCRVCSVSRDGSSGAECLSGKVLRHAYYQLRAESVKETNTYDTRQFNATKEGK